MQVPCHRPHVPLCAMPVTHLGSANTFSSSWLDVGAGLLSANSTLSSTAAMTSFSRLAICNGA